MPNSKLHDLLYTSTNTLQEFTTGKSADIRHHHTIKNMVLLYVSLCSCIIVPLYLCNKFITLIFHEVLHLSEMYQSSLSCNYKSKLNQDLQSFDTIVNQI